MAIQAQAEATPAMGNPLKAYLISQFGNPRGLLGALAGNVMARRASNIKRNLWTIELMDLKPTDRVLEIGFGPGFALEQVCVHLNGGMAVGLDRSETMLRMARRRNHQAIAEGHLDLVLGSIEETKPLCHPSLSGPFDAVYAVNVAMFWRDPVKNLRALSARLSDSGRILLTFQPRTGARTDEAAMVAGENIAQHMREAGLGGIRIECLKSVSPMAVCVIGKNV
jgi:SAM-dependent methyltransferase